MQERLTRPGHKLSIIGVSIENAKSASNASFRSVEINKRQACLAQVQHLQVRGKAAALKGDYQGCLSEYLEEGGFSETEAGDRGACVVCIVS